MASINVYFKQGTDPDMAAVNVQNRVAKAQNLLPAEVTRVGVIAEKRQTSMLMVFSLFSPDDRYSLEFLKIMQKLMSSLNSACIWCRCCRCYGDRLFYASG